MATLKKYLRWLSSPTSMHTSTTLRPQKGEPALMHPYSHFTHFHFTHSYSHHPKKWLQPMDTHPLEKLVYIDIGFGYQYLRMEFRLPGACYSFLMRDEDKCTACSSTLACKICPEGGVVRWFVSRWGVAKTVAIYCRAGITIFYYH